ncbi:predicted protein [Aspergillus terreus NIH2624]|uniref:Uncharacterized protein n=1 Tax=Aspergillus terreus (strain NIH 2624 / FGSC A1156) TaxID=341663 RepID=Q0CLS9_ASPTN|nr:uncharacterized protein ATEG_05355 [Aspergillus terreus NIH2624]EAU34424.1 predicted protein [Aspergillus terreus NIH2624]
MGQVRAGFPEGPISRRGELQVRHIIVAADPGIGQGIVRVCVRGEGCDLLGTPEAGREVVGHVDGAEVERIIPVQAERSMPDLSDSEPPNEYKIRRRPNTARYKSPAKQPAKLPDV